MTVRPATSTPCPLPREREKAEKRPRLSIAGAIATRTANDNDSGLTPTTTIQTKEGESDSRLATLARIDVPRIEIHKLVDDVALRTEIELLDLMRDEVVSYSRHKAAQETRTWTGAAGVQFETGLMMLGRALRPAST
jgi:hypothetical protein